MSGHTQVRQIVVLGGVLCEGSQAGTLKIWDLEAAGHTQVRHIVVGGILCTGSQAGTLKIWDLEAARLVQTHTGGAYSSRRDTVHG